MFDYVDTERVDGVLVQLQGYGHYYETYRKGDDGQWRISSKRNVRPAPTLHRRRRHEDRPMPHRVHRCRPDGHADGATPHRRRSRADGLRPLRPEVRGESEAAGAAATDDVRMAVCDADAVVVCFVR